MESERFNRGMEKLKELDPNAGDLLVEVLKNIAPDLARYAVEFPYGDVYSREGLTIKERQIATISALAALGNATPQLKLHINGALNIGCTRKEIAEIMIQMTVYAGFPAALNGISTAMEVFAERDSSGLSE